MKNWVYGIFILFITTHTAIAQDLHTSILFSKEKNYIIHEQVLYECNKKGELKMVLKFQDQIYKAIRVQNKLWLASDKGLYIYDLPHLKLEKTEFLNKKIVDLVVDSERKLWVVTLFDGVYRQKDNQEFEQKLNVMTNYCIASTPDGNIYVGTNMGMYNLSINNPEIVRYAEEAHSGHGLPDNIVEALYTDEESNVWIVMPDNVAFKKSDNYVGEIPTFSYVGDKENKIYKIIALQNQSYLFVTQQGVLLLPSASLKEHNHGDEVFSGHDTQALQLVGELLNAPEDLLTEPILSAEKNGNQIYFFTLKGIWGISEKSLIKKIKKIK